MVQSSYGAVAGLVPATSPDGTPKSFFNGSSGFRVDEVTQPRRG